MTEIHFTEGIVQGHRVRVLGIAGKGATVFAQERVGFRDQPELGRVVGRAVRHVQARGDELVRELVPRVLSGLGVTQNPVPRLLAQRHVFRIAVPMAVIAGTVMEFRPRLHA